MPPKFHAQKVKHCQKSEDKINTVVGSSFTRLKHFPTMPLLSAVFWWLMAAHIKLKTVM